MITDDQQARLTVVFATIKGETVDVGVFGDSIDIAKVSEAIRQCLASAGVLLQNFTPLGGGGAVRGVLVGVSPDASPAVKSAANSFVTILRETLGGGVGLWDFAQLDFNGSAMTGNSEGALPRGTGPLRIWIGGK